MKGWKETCYFSPTQTAACTSTHPHKKQVSTLNYSMIHFPMSVNLQTDNKPCMWLLKGVLNIHHWESTMISSGPSQADSESPWINSDVFIHRHLQKHLQTSPAPFAWKTVHFHLIKPQILPILWLSDLIWAIGCAVPTKSLLFNLILLKQDYGERFPLKWTASSSLANNCGCCQPWISILTCKQICTLEILPPAQSRNAALKKEPFSLISRNSYFSN